MTHRKMATAPMRIFSRLGPNTHRSPSENRKPIATLPYSKNRKSFRFRFFSDHWRDIFKGYHTSAILSL